MHSDMGDFQNSVTYVKKLLRRCVTCVRLTGKPYRLPDPPTLLKTRTEDLTRSLIVV